jgi:antitoxin (DNA-binding transcriptional repressor) of toxin-antitoxin stability system
MWEQFTITVSGRPVAELGPVAKRRRVGAPALENVVQTPAPTTLAAELERFPGHSATRSSDRVLFDTSVQIATVDVDVRNWAGGRLVSPVAGTES